MSESPGKMTDARCKNLIDSTGFNRNPMSGTPGEFYKEDREADLQAAIYSILFERRFTSR